MQPHQRYTCDSHRGIYYILDCNDKSGRHWDLHPGLFSTKFSLESKQRIGNKEGHIRHLFKRNVFFLVIVIV